MMADSLFVRSGDLVRPTHLTVGPWSPDAQHGGPPAALLAGAIERTPSAVDMMLARVSVELLRPVPLEPLAVTTEMIRPGRRIQLVAASLLHDDQEVARATGLKIRLANLDLPFEQSGPEDPPGPTEGRPPTWFENPGAFATEAMEIRMLEGDFAESGPGRAWFRLRVPLIQGESTTPLERVAAAADFGNGVSNLIGATRNWVFINPDLEIRMARRPEGEWFCLDSTTQVDTRGTGLATSVLSDQRGRLGVAAQSLFVEEIGAS
jgi:hypothetical protein